MDIEIGDWLASLRGKRSQESIAKAAGIQRTSLTDIENGAYLPTPTTLGKILAAMDCDGRLAEGDAILSRCHRERAARKSSAA